MSQSGQGTVTTLGLVFFLGGLLGKSSQQAGRTVMRRRERLLVVSVYLAAGPLLSGCGGEVIERASVANDGSEANDFSAWPSISQTGRFVAFESSASDLVPGDINGVWDIFVRDTCVEAPTGCTPSTIRVSLASGTTQMNDGNSAEPSISANGRFVAFASWASNLVPNDANFRGDVFVHDSCIEAAAGCTPSTIRVSVTSGGTEAQGGSPGGGFPSISPSGRFVAFSSTAPNLVVGDTNVREDIFVRDTCVRAPAGCTPSTIRVSLASNGTQANGLSRYPFISSNGRFVAFHSRATNLVAGDTNGAWDIFVRDTCAGAPAGCTPSTIRVSVASDGSEANGFSDRPSISTADGLLVAFASSATNLVAGDTNGAWDIFVRNTCIGAPPTCTPRTIRVSVAGDGTQGDNLNSGQPSISADGRFVAFRSGATNLVPGDTNSLPDVFVRDTCVGAPADCTPSTIRVSLGSGGTQGNGESSWFVTSISDKGEYVAFDSNANNLVPDDNNGVLDVFLAGTR